MKTLHVSLCLSLFPLVACVDQTTLVVLTDAPPSRVAEVIDDEVDDELIQTVRLSSGVAVAVECFFLRAEDYGYGLGDPCQSLEITSAPADLLDVEPAHLDGSPWVNPYQAQQTGAAADPEGRDRSVAILVGREPGQGVLTVRHGGQELNFDLEIIAHDPPEPE